LKSFRSIPFFLEKIPVKLMNKHDCSREEAKTKYAKYFKCNYYVDHWTNECTQSNDTFKTATNNYSKHAYIVWSKLLHEEVPYIAAFITESGRKLTDNHYKWIFNLGANINVICNDELLINIRKIEKQSANDFGGPVTFTEVGDHPLFGECFINRE
jgi:hypothetical protein